MPFVSTLCLKFKIYLDIKIGNGKIHTDPNRYSDEDVYKNVIKYYKYYYDKYNK